MIKFRIYLFLHTVIVYKCSLMRVKNVHDSFNTEFTGNNVSCIFENTSWIGEYLAYFNIILEYFVNC